VWELKDRVCAREFEKGVQGGPVMLPVIIIGLRFAWWAEVVKLVLQEGRMGIKIWFDRWFGLVERRNRS
jgi:hypothetical protein